MKKTTRPTISVILALIVCLSIILHVENGTVTNGDKAGGQSTVPVAIPGRICLNTTPTQRVRRPVATGSFYPAEAKELYKEVADLIDSAPPLSLSGVRAILVPHAGYVFSGAIAAEAFREISKDFKRVIILAANHNGNAYFAGVSLPPYSHYVIPGASIPLSHLRGKLLSNPLFTSIEQAHSKHVIEIELPFLQQIKGAPISPDYAILPMILGQVDSSAAHKLAETLNRIATPETLFVFSVDLSHYYSEQQAQRLDSYTIQSLLSGDTDALSRAVTDGNQVLMTLSELARLQGWESTLLRYGHSGQTNGEKNRVVGYAAIAFHSPFSLNAAEKHELLELARTTITAYLETGISPLPDERLLNRFPNLKIPRAAFVTLRKNGSLRGCIGNLTSNAPLYTEVQNCAINAATRDRRFPPVNGAEIESLDLSISVLSQPKRVHVAHPNEYPRTIRLGEDGIILIHNGRSSTFLPSVWKDIPDPTAFLSQLCLKQGAKPGCWNDEGTILYRYDALEFAE